MSALSTLFEQFLRERRYLKNVTPKTAVWYESAFGGRPAAGGVCTGQRTAHVVNPRYTVRTSPDSRSYLGQPSRSCGNDTLPNAIPKTSREASRNRPRHRI